MKPKINGTTVAGGLVAMAALAAVTAPSLILAIGGGYLARVAIEKARKKRNG